MTQAGETWGPDGIGLPIEDSGPLETSLGSIYDYEASLGEAFDASFQAQFDTNPLLSIGRTGAIGLSRVLDPRIPADEARRQIQERGLDLTVPDAGISALELNTIIYLKERERDRNMVLARRSGAFTTVSNFTAGLAAGVTDPLNILSGFVPVLSAGRYAAAINAASGPLGRLGVRAAVGAAEGAVGAALLEPFVYTGAQVAQLDYGVGDSFANIVFGSVAGAGMHSIGGAIADGFRPSRARVAMSAAPEDVKVAALTKAVNDLEEGLPVNIDEVVSAWVRDGYKTADDADFLHRAADITDEEFQSARAVAMDARGLQNTRKPPSFWEVIKSYGGIKITEGEYGDRSSEGGDVMAILGGKSPAPGVINNKTGKTPDQMREALNQDGWFGTAERLGGDASSDLGGMAPFYELLERAVTEKGRVRPPEELSLDRRKELALEELAKHGIDPTEGGLSSVATKLAEARLLEQARRAADDPDFDPIDILYREDSQVGDEGVIAEPLTIEQAAQYEPWVDEWELAASQEADDAIKAAPSEDLQSVQDEIAAAQEVINGLKARELWDAADEADIGAGEDVAKDLDMLAKVYRAAGVCMME